jgi:predicted transcriptional regulator
VVEIKKRDRLQVIYDILKVIQKNKNLIKPTPLLRFSNLSSQRFSEYEKDLLEKDLIVEVLDKKRRRHYKITEKGFKYLEKYHLIRGFVDEFDL